MERNKVCFAEGPAEECSIIDYITKSILFVIVAVFVLYLPLGDPGDHCSNRLVRDKSDAICCLCDIHKFLLIAASKTADAAKVLVCVIIDALYESKLKFYAMLEKLDRDDLCRSVCCNIDPEEESEAKDKRSRPPCRCIKRKCPKNQK